jgi:periplasmic copper chaperone A
MRIIMGIISGLILSNMAMAEQTLQVSDAYVRASLPGQTTASAFVTLKNPLDKALVLTKIHSKVAATVELHSHQMVNGQLQMRKIENFTIAPKGEARFRPGENHIMLMGITSPLQENTTIKIKMCFDDLCSVIEMPVISVLNESNKPAGGHDNHH